jgi:hypothetical protein
MAALWAGLFVGTCRAGRGQFIGTLTGCSSGARQGGGITGLQSAHPQSALIEFCLASIRIWRPLSAISKRFSASRNRFAYTSRQPLPARGASLISRSSMRFHSSAAGPRAETAARNSATSACSLRKLTSPTYGWFRRSRHWRLSSILKSLRSAFVRRATSLSSGVQAYTIPLTNSRSTRINMGKKIVLNRLSAADCIRGRTRGCVL